RVSDSPRSDIVAAVHLSSGHGRDRPIQRNRDTGQADHAFSISSRRNRLAPIWSHIAMKATRRDGSLTSGYTTMHVAVAVTFGWLGVSHFTSLPLVGSHLKELLFLPFVFLSITALSTRGEKSRPTFLICGFAGLAL